MYIERVASIRQQRQADLVSKREKKEVGLASSPFRITHFKLAESFSALRYLPCDIIFIILHVF
jgi:hypothetical protein